MLGSFCLMFAIGLWPLKLFHVVLQMQSCDHRRRRGDRLNIVQVTMLLEHWCAISMSWVQATPWSLFHSVTSLGALNYFFIRTFKNIDLYEKLHGTLRCHKHPAAKTSICSLKVIPRINASRRNIYILGGFLLLFF